MSKRVVVIGAGIIGLCTAYYLEQEGHEVVIIDKSDITSGASFVNAGLITPSHIISLAAPGVITKAIRGMFSSLGSFYIKPRLNFDFLQWSWLFKKSAISAKVKKSIPVIRDINLLSRELYEQLKQSDDFNFYYQRKGLLMMYKTDQAGEEEWKVGKKAIQYGLKVEHLQEKQIKDLEPYVNSDVKGAVYYHTDAHMNPGEFMQQLKSCLEKKGIVFNTNYRVSGFYTISNRVKFVKTQEESIECDEVVIATGAWSQNLMKVLGVNIPVQAGKGYRIDVLKNTGITIPSILSEAKVAVTPMNGFTRFSGAMEIGGINHTINSNRVNAIADAAGNYYSGLKINEQEKRHAQCGLRPCSPDGLPYIGKLNHTQNVTVVAGHAMMGWSLGPATGKLAAELVSDKKTSLNITPFKVERF